MLSQRHRALWRLEQKTLGQRLVPRPHLNQTTLSQRLRCGSVRRPRVLLPRRRQHLHLRLSIRMQPSRPRPPTSGRPPRQALRLFPRPKRCCCLWWDWLCWWLQHSGFGSGGYSADLLMCDPVDLARLTVRKCATSISRPNQRTLTLAHFRRSATCQTSAGGFFLLASSRAERQAKAVRGSHCSGYVYPS